MSDLDFENREKQSTPRRSELRLLLPTRFSAYRLDRVPWGLPFQFLQFPYAITLFDRILCDKWGLKADIDAYLDLHWTSGYAFKRLYEEGILERVEPIAQYPSLDVFKPLTISQRRDFLEKQRATRGGISHFDKFDASCTALLADKMGATAFGWTQANIDFDQSTLQKARVFFDLVLKYFPLMPPFDDLSPPAFRQFEDARRREADLWVQLEEGAWSVDEYRRRRASVMTPKDRIIDEELIPIVEKRLRLVLEMRRTFADLRHSLNRYITDIQDGNITVAQFRSDWEAIVPKEIKDYEVDLSRRERKFSVRLLLTTMPIFLGTMLNSPITQLFLIATLGPEAARTLWSNWKEADHSKRVLPCGYLNHRFMHKIPLGLPPDR